MCLKLGILTDFHAQNNCMLTLCQLELPLLLRDILVLEQVDIASEFACFEELLNAWTL
jgi:hypothetical protein